MFLNSSFYYYIYIYWSLKQIDIINDFIFLPYLMKFPKKKLKKKKAIIQWLFYKWKGNTQSKSMHETEQENKGYKN